MVISEAHFRLNREKNWFIPEEKWDVAGKLVIIDKDPDSGKELRIDLHEVWFRGLFHPVTCEELKFETDAKLF